jgi:hypothetical protein
VCVAHGAPRCRLIDSARAPADDARCFHNHARRTAMPKGQQRTNKEAKKPKKDSSPSKPLSPGAVMPTIVTVVPERSKKKK